MVGHQVVILLVKLTTPVHQMTSYHQHVESGPRLTHGPDQFFVENGEAEAVTLIIDHHRISSLRNSGSPH